MEQYTLQSYFKSACNSFYIVYEQVKRLERLEEEFGSTYSEEELEQKYIASKYSKEELEKRKKELKQAEEEYYEKCKELQEPKCLWNEHLWGMSTESISYILNKISEKNFSVIVTSKEEIIALMLFFRYRSVKEYRIINTDEQYLKSFPTGEKMYEEFFTAYFLEDDEEMKKVIKKYF